ncbi:substrate-binding periplasmic protein [Rhodoferax aquaticus]|nr:transporter substrate-binding domain-containing protein [Rhodoferax aquaticus]
MQKFVQRCKRGVVGLACMTAVGLSYAAETVTLGAEDDWAPYSSKVGSEAQGFAVDIVREAFKAAGVDVKFSPVPYARCMAVTKSGELAGCFDAARNSTLENDYLWHAKPLFNARINIYAPADSKESGLTPKSLEGKVVGVTNGYEYGDEFDTNTKIKRDVANQDEQGFRKLLANRVPYMLAYEKVANAVFTKNKEFAGKFKAVGITADPGLYIAFSKKHPDGAKFVEKFNQGFETIVKNGKYKAIEVQWK